MTVSLIKVLLILFFGVPIAGATIFGVCAAMAMQREENRKEGKANA